MANISNFVFFDENSTETTSNSMSNMNFAGAITVQVESLSEGETISLTVEGMQDLKNPDSYFPIKIVSLGTFGTIDEITEPGLYVIPIIGINRVRMVSGGTVGGFKASCISIG